jgi:hypothetical protein
MLVTRVRVLVGVWTVAALMCVAATAAKAASQRYASVAGTGVTCSAALPCSLAQAIGGAGSGDEVNVGPGTYVQLAELDATAPNLSVHGVAGVARPLIRFFSTNGLVFASATNGTVRHLEVEQLGTTGSITALSVGFGGVVDDVIARSSAGFGHGCFFRNATVTNTLCMSSGSGGTALQTQANLAATTMTLRNVTAVSTGASGVGVSLQAFSGHGLGATLVNTIAQGGSTGLSATTDSSLGASSVAHISYSDIPSRATSGSGAAIDDRGHNLATPPTFANLTAGDLHELASSVTVDHGVDDPANGTVDLDGHPRSLGSASDIGAYELPERPAATTSAAAPVHVIDAQLNALINPEGLPTTVSFQYGTTGAYGASTVAQPVGSGRSTQLISALLAGLAPRTTYHYRVVAVNAAGSTFGDDVAFTTAAPQRALIVVKRGSGSGSVRSSPAGIDCGASCANVFAAGTRVTLTANPGFGSAFAGWSGGGCSGTGRCTVTISSDKTVTATFSRHLPVLSRLSVSPRRFALAGRLVRRHCLPATHANRAHRHCTRAIKLRISYRLNVAAHVMITIARKLTGRRVHGRCLTPAPTNRRHRTCTRLRAVRGTLTGRGKQGANRLTFNGRIGKRRLTPGRYRLTATPTANGKTGKRRSTAFTITP